MSVLQIRQARREGARVVIGIAGVSGSGKTHTAALVALGLAGGDASKVGFIDTENRRGSLYADVYQQIEGDGRTDVPFLIGDLYPPFSPQRYIEAIHEFQAAGVRVLIIDSASHEWEGQGGAEEIATAGDPRMPNWNKAKAEHKRFMNAALQCDMDIVMCFRAREKAKPEKQMVGGREKTVYVELGLQPITEKNVMFEMTVSMMVHDQGTRRDILKCPAALAHIFQTDAKYIGFAQGRALRTWLDGAGQLDAKVESWRNRLLSNAEQGMIHIAECWEKTPANIKKSLGEQFYDTIKKAAQEFDKQRADASKAAEDSSLASLATPDSPQNKQGDGLGETRAPEDAEAAQRAQEQAADLSALQAAPAEPERKQKPPRKVEPEAKPADAPAEATKPAARKSVEVF